MRSPGNAMTIDCPDQNDFGRKASKKGPNVSFKRDVPEFKIQSWHCGFESFEEDWNYKVRE